eukprot:10277522-Alexandrium_andersonii.AAC.1
MLRTCRSRAVFRVAECPAVHSPGTDVESTPNLRSRKLHSWVLQGAGRYSVRSVPSPSCAVPSIGS